LTGGAPLPGGEGRRITYLIDKDGIIRFIQEGVPRNKDFLKAIEKLEQKP
jgi:peroxiredoxin